MKRRHPALADRVNIIAALVIIALAAASLLVQSNAGYYAGGTEYDRQTIWFVVGGVAFVFCAVVDLRLVERASYVIYVGCLGLLVLTLLIGGGETAGSGQVFRRWISLGGFNIQASEITKLAVILALARYLHGRRERNPGETETVVGRYGLRDLGRPLALIVLPVPLIMQQPDLGTSLMLLFVGGTMLAMEGMTRRAVVTLALTGLIAVPVAWKTGLIRDYQKDRIYKIVDQDWEKVDETGKVWDRRMTQVEQSIWAIGSGGFAGAGHRGANTTRLKVLPEIHTDFIAAMAAEERGFVGMTILLFLFWCLVMWAFRTAHDARTRFSMHVAIGFAALLGWQVFINIGMVTGVLPVVGLPLPFLSYGGSALIMMLAGLGLMFNIVMRRGRL